VLRLPAVGRTNAQIGAKLHISPKILTVCLKHQLRQDDPRRQWAHFGAAAARWISGLAGRFMLQAAGRRPVMPMSGCGIGRALSGSDAVSC
jgi:hypothetical protein